MATYPPQGSEPWDATLLAYLETNVLGDPGDSSGRVEGDALVFDGSQWEPTAVVPVGDTSQVGNVYVSTTGSDSNDGLTVGTPFATFQKAFDYLETQGPILQGTWTVNAAAGTYVEFDATLTTRSVNRIVVCGPSVSGGTPTAILDGSTGGDYQHGLRASGIGVRVEFRDLKAIDFDFSNTQIGFVGESESDVYFNNVHADNCSWTGIYAFNTVRCRVDGGVWDGCRSGFIANDTEATLTGATITNSTESGVYWSRGSQGHVDGCTIEDNAVGLYVSQSSRVNADGNTFNRNTSAVRCDSGGVFADTSNTYGTGADLNTTKLEYRAFSGDSAELNSNSSAAPIRIAYDRTARTVTGVTVLTNLVPTVYTIPAYRLQGVGKSVRVVVRGVYTMTAASTFSMKIGTNTLTLAVPAAATALSFCYDVTLYEVQGGYRAFGQLSQGVSAHRMGTATGFTDSSSAAISLDVTPANSADTVSVYRTDVYLEG